jgi:hypothetical protein
LPERAEISRVIVLNLNTLDSTSGDMGLNPIPLQQFSVLSALALVNSKIPTLYVAGSSIGRAPILPERAERIEGYRF